jgi:small subunit ribosomal protein S16
MVKIRLMRMGKRKQPTYRVVVADARSPRDGRFIENIGKYEPRSHPSRIDIDEERALHWLRSGAQPSDPVRVLLERTGIWAAFTGGAPPAPFDFTEKERAPKPAEEPEPEAPAEPAPEAEAPTEPATEAPIEAATEATAEPTPEPEPEPAPQPAEETPSGQPAEKTPERPGGEEAAEETS